MQGRNWHPKKSNTQLSQATQSWLCAFQANLLKQKLRRTLIQKQERMYEHKRTGEIQVRWRLACTECGKAPTSKRHTNPSNRGCSTILPAGFAIRYAASSKTHQSLRRPRDEILCSGVWLSKLFIGLFLKKGKEHVVVLMGTLLHTTTRSRLAKSLQAVNI